MNSTPRIVFWGTSDFAVSALSALIKTGYEVMAVITRPDKPAGRKHIPSPSPVKISAEQYNLKILQPKTLKDDEIFKLFKLLNPELCIIAAYGKIIPKRYLDVSKYGFLNIHPSLLPKYRGPSPIQTAILNGDTETGVSIMLVDEEMDHGPVLAQQEFSILNSQFSNSKELEKELAEFGAELLVEMLPKYINGEIKPKPQDHKMTTFTKMFSREDGRINWAEPAEKIYNLIRALNPEPGTWTTWKRKVINIPTLRVVCPQVKEKPGTVRKIGKDIVVATGKCYLILKEVQLEGGKKMDAKSFINGHPSFLNSVLE